VHTDIQRPKPPAQYPPPRKGAIDAEELQGALASMGVHKSEAEVAELMAGVDEDGSGAVVGVVGGDAAHIVRQQGGPGRICHHRASRATA
jgi:hypothetical protein